MSNKNCTYTFTNGQGQKQTIMGLSSMKAFLVDGGLDLFYPSGRFPWLATESAIDIIQSGRFQPITPDQAGNMRAGDVVVDDQGNEYMALHARHKWLEVAPIVDGRPQVSADTTIKFHLEPETKHLHKQERRGDPIYATGRNLYSQEAIPAGAGQASDQMAGLIAIAADSIESLRRSDVDRVITEAPAELKRQLAEHIKAKRPDLAGEVDDVMAEAAAQKPSGQKYAGPADVSSRAGQMELANRAGTIATLKAMNAQLRSIAPDEAWADANIEEAADLDALRTAISEALVKAQKAGQADPNEALRKRLEEASGEEVKSVFGVLNLAGPRIMSYSERINALLAQDAQAVSDALDQVLAGTPQTGPVERRPQLTGANRYSPTRAIPGLTTEADAAAQNKVVDYMNGDISRTELMNYLSASGIPEGKIISFTQRMQNDGPSMGEIKAMLDTRSNPDAAPDNTQAEKIADDLKGDLERVIADSMNRARDWSTRKYGKSNKTVTYEGDGPARNESVSVDGANERRRQDAIRTFEAVARGSQAAIDAINQQGGSAFMAVLADGYRGSDADFESKLIGRFGFDGATGKGAMSSNAATKAILGAVKRYLDAVQSNTDDAPDWMQEMFGQDEKKSSASRFEIGRSLTKEQRQEVLVSLTDVYKEKGADRELKGLDQNGNERYGYVYSPDLFEKSDITGAMVRHYVTLPDGRKAHPTELFPDYTQSDIDSEMLRRENEEAAARDRRESRLQTLRSRMADTLGKANRIFNTQNPGSRDYTPAILTNGQQFIRTAPESAEGDAELLGDGWVIQQESQAAESPKLTQAEAAKLMEWQNLGQKDGVKTHILTFYESQADKDAKRGRMIMATVSMGDRSSDKWSVDGDDQTFTYLAAAKKRAIEVGMAKAVRDGFVEAAEGRAIADTSNDKLIGKDINGNDVFMGTDGPLKDVPYRLDERGQVRTGVALDVATMEAIDKEAENKPASDSLNKPHAIDKKRVLTPSGAISAGARNSDADSSVWYHQGDIKMLAMTASVKIDGQLSKGADEAKRIIEAVSTAQKAGWALRNYRAGTLGTVWTLEKGDQFLTRAGLENIDAEQIKDPQIPDYGPGWESMVRGQKDLAKALFSWLSTLPPEQRENQATVSRKMADVLGGWAYIERDKLGLHVRYKPAKKPEGSRVSGAQWTHTIPAATDWSHALQIIAEMAEGSFDAKPAEETAATAVANASSTTPVTDSHVALMDVVRSGKATPEQFKAGFEAFVASKSAILTELAAKTKVQLLREGGPYMQMRYASEKKADVVDAIYRQMLGEYALGESVTYGMGKDSYLNAVRKMVEATDADKLARYVQERNAALEEMKARREAKAAAMQNPKTLEDYREVVKSRVQEGMTTKEAFLSLTPEQRIRYDTLAAESTRDARESRKRAMKNRVSAASQTTGGQVIATKHTRGGYDLFVVQLADRLSAEDYKTVLASAKKLGGWYSSFRGGGATPGFQFKDRASADAFLALAGGDKTAAQNQVEQRRDAFEDDRGQTAVERLRAMADKLEEQASEEEGRDRKANTARRARFASAALAAAAAEKAKARTMRNIAQAIEDGKAKFLDEVRTKSQVDMLTSIVETAKANELRAKYPSYADQEKRKGEPPTAETADFADFPNYSAFRSDLAILGRQLLEVDGTKKLGQRLMAVADDVTDAYLEFAKANLLRVSQFGRGDALADFGNQQEAERAIKRSGLTGKAIVLQVKRGQNRVILSPSEAIGRGIWAGDGDKRITLTVEFGNELVEAIGRRGNKSNRLTVPWQFQNAYDRRKALSRIGIETASEFRSALREFIGLKEQATANRVRELELQMVGRQKDGLDFFPTAAEVADQMVEAADLSPDMAVLEPSAGMGHLADRIREAGAEPDVIELSPDRRELLEEKGYHLAEVDDFMAMEPRKFFTYGDVFRAPDGTEGIMRGVGHMGSQRVRLEDEAGNRLGLYDRSDLVGVRHRGVWSGYDRIIMNPPFSNRRDAEHVRHAYDLLKPGGRIVAIMGEGVFFGQDQKAVDFRDWLDSVGGTSEKLPEGSFMDPSLPVNTSVNARMVVIDKPQLPGGEVQFSRAPRSPNGLTATETQSIADAIAERWANAPEIVVAADMNDAAIPQAVRDYDARQRSLGAQGEPEGFWYGGKVYLVASSMRTPSDVMRVLFHEALGHYGLRGVFGERLNVILQQIASQRRAEVQAKADEYGLDMAIESQRLQAAEEVLAVMAQTNPKLGFVKRAIGAIRSWLRRTMPGLFEQMELTDAEIIRDYILPARAFVERGATGKAAGGAAFSRSDSPIRAALGELIRAEAAWDAVRKGDPKNVSMQQFLELSGRSMTARKQAAEQLASLPDDGFALQAAASGGRMLILTPSAQQPGRWQLTRFDPQGNPWGDTNFDTKQQAIREFLDEADLSTITTGDGVSFSRSQDQTKTEAFKRWFGDDGAVDDDGNPQIFYHGGNSSFSEITSKGRFGSAIFAREEAPSGYGKTQHALYLNKPVLELDELADLLDSEEGHSALERAASQELSDDDAEQLIEALTDGSHYPDNEDVWSLIGAIDESDAQIEIQRLRGRVTKELGYAAVRTPDEFDGETVMIVDPSSIKSATGNNGDFDPSNPDIRFSRATPAPAAQPSAWEAPADTIFDRRVVYALQDKHVDTKRVQAAITKTAGEIEDEVNAYQREELYHGRAAKRTQDFLTQELNPMVEQLAKDDIELADFEEFLHARHAPEANRVLAERNPNQAMIDAGLEAATLEIEAVELELANTTDPTEIKVLSRRMREAQADLSKWSSVQAFRGPEEDRLMLSGMSDQQAQAIMAALAPEQRQKLDDAAAQFDAIVAQNRQLMVDYDLEDQETVDSWGQLFQHYVPLMREDEGNGIQQGMGTGQGFSIKGREVKSRTGSTRKVVDIVANVAMQRERIITRGEKNRVSQALMGLAALNPNPDFWKLGAPDKKRQYDPATNTVKVVTDPQYKNRENVVVAKVRNSKGRVTEVALTFNERDERAVRMAAAIKNLEDGQLNWALGNMAKITRYLASINTQYNPIFGVVNVIRDMQGAAVNLAGTPLKDSKTRIIRNAIVAIGSIYRGARQERKGRENESGWGKLWLEFQEVGGMTGFRDQFRDSKDRARAIERTMNPEKWMDSAFGKVVTAGGLLKAPMTWVQDGAGWVLDLLSDYNLAMENGVRLATYKAGLDKGLTKEQAASLAKNITVNFNRRGTHGMQIGAAYAFFNAAMQGTARMGQAFTTMEDGKIKTLRLSPLGKKVLAGGVMMGVAQAVVLAAAGFGDDEPPDFVREKNMIIPTGWTGAGSDKGYVTVPMPLGLHVIPGLGRHMTEFVMNGGKDPAGRIIAIFGMLLDAFNPIGNAGWSLQTIVPTVLDPLAALAENKDFTGRNIALESRDKNVPGHKLAKDTASTLSKFLSEAINTLTGGNDYVSGHLSPTPDQIDYLFGQLTGGVGREALKAEQVVSSSITGEELPLYKIPLVGRFVGDSSSSAGQSNIFRANIDRLDRAEKEIEGLRKDGRLKESETLRQKSDPYLLAQARVAESQVQRLRRMKRDMVDKGASREAVRDVERKITEAMTRLNKAVESRSK